MRMASQKKWTHDGKEEDKRGCGDTKWGEEAREDASLLLADPCLTLIGLAYIHITHMQISYLTRRRGKLSIPEL